MPVILKKLSKTGDPFIAISDQQNNEEHVLFQAGNKATQTQSKVQISFIF